MKAIVLLIIKIYKIFISPFQELFLIPSGCRFFPTCSEYAYKSVEKYGAPRGLWMAFKRILGCNPWNS